MAIVIQLADAAATDAWENAGFGAFDPNSELADEIDADDDGFITEAEIQEYTNSSNTQGSSSNTQNNSSAAKDSKIETSYSVVNVGDINTEDCGSMKDLLNQCLSSFDAMARFVKNLVSKSNDLTSEINGLTNEVNAISTNDGTGSGQNSAYSLTFAGDEPSTTNGEATDTSQSTNSSTLNEINDKINKSAELSGEVSNNSTALAQVSEDMKVTAGSVEKIVSAAEEIKTKDQWTRIGEALTDPSKPFRLVNIGNVLSSVDDKQKEKEEIQALGKEAAQHGQMTQETIKKAVDPVKDASSASTELEVNLKYKKS